MADLTLDDIKQLINNTNIGKLKAPTEVKGVPKVLPDISTLPPVDPTQGPAQEPSYLDRFKQSLSNSITPEAAKTAGATMAGIGALGAGLGIPATMAASASQDPRLADIKNQDISKATNTGAQVIGKAALGGQLADTDTAKTISQVMANALGGTVQGLGQGVHSVGKLVSDTAGTIGQGVKAGLNEITPQPISTALSHGNPLEAVGNTLEAVLPGQVSNPKSLLNILQGGLQYSALAPGWDVVSKALGLGGVYPQAQTQEPSLTHETQVKSEPADYFNIQNPLSVTSSSTQSVEAINNKYNTDMFNLEAAERMAIAKNPNARLDIQKQIQELKKNATDTLNAQLAQVKTTKERASDLGSYVQGSDDYKDLVNKSNTLKKMDSVIGDLEEAKNKGDVKSVGAIGTELIGFLNKVQGQQVTEEQRNTLNPLIQQVHGLFGLGAGQVINPSNYPVMLNTIKAIRSELTNDLASYTEKPGANIPEDKKAWLYNNEIKPSKEKTFAPKVTVGDKDYALGMDKETNPVLIDPKTNYPYEIKDGKPVGIKMLSGKLAMEGKDGLTYEDGSPIDQSKDRIATVLPMSPAYLNYNEYGFPVPDKNNSIQVSKLTPNGDTFEIVYNNSQAGKGSNAIQLMTARNIQNIKQEGGNEAAQLAARLGGVAAAGKNIPVVGDILNSLSGGLQKTGNEALAGNQGMPAAKFQTNTDIVNQALGLNQGNQTKENQPTPAKPANKPTTPNSPSADDLAKYQRAKEAAAKGGVKAAEFANQFEVKYGKR